jgi:hypothetical protein
MCIYIYVYIYTYMCGACVSCIYVLIICVCSDIVTDPHFGANITPKKVPKC